MSEYVNVAEQFLEIQMEKFNYDIKMHEKCISDLKRQVNGIENELRSRSKMKRLLAVEECKRKLRELLDADEYDIVMSVISNQTQYNFDELLIANTEDICYMISNYKKKFESINVKLVDLTICGQYDTLPPKYLYNCIFKLEEYPDIFISTEPGSNCFSEKTKEFLNEIDNDEEFSFISQSEKEYVASFFMIFGDSHREEILSRLRLIKDLFPDKKIFNISKQPGEKITFCII